MSDGWWETLSESGPSYWPSRMVMVVVVLLLTRGGSIAKTDTLAFSGVHIHRRAT
jgi:hypothetical protein